MTTAADVPQVVVHLGVVIDVVTVVAFYLQLATVLLGR